PPSEEIDNDLSSRVDHRWSASRRPRPRTIPRARIAATLLSRRPTVNRECACLLREHRRYGDAGVKAAPSRSGLPAFGGWPPQTTSARPVQAETKSWRIRSGDLGSAATR